MGKLIGIELEKMKHTFLQVLIIISLLGPIALITIMYAITDNKSFFEVVKSNSAFVQLIPFSVTVIFGCFIVAREYKENMMLYLKITPQSQVRIIISKLIVIELELWLTQVVTFILLSVINTVIGGFDTNLLLRYIGAGLISAGALGLLIPVMIYMSLLRRSFSGAALIFLVLFMMTFPFIFSENGHLFPHLIPMLFVAKFFGSSVYNNMRLLYGLLILAAIAGIFLYLSIKKMKQKE